MRLIDADALKEKVPSDAKLTIGHYTFINNSVGVNFVRETIDDAPTIDAVEVKHGTWTVDGINEYELSYGSTGYEPVYRCSRCGHVTESYLRLDRPIMPEDADFPNYCPHCGARMDLDEVAE